MDTKVALVIFFVVLILLYLLIRNYQIKPFSAFVVALLISTILLGFLAPPMDVYANREQGAAQFYGLIMFVSTIIFFLYILFMALKDKEAGVTTTTNWF